MIRYVILLHILRQETWGFSIVSRPPKCRRYQEVLPLCNEESEGSYSFVEGEDFSGSLEEIEAMGGDPFFLLDEENDKTRKGEAGGDGDDDDMDAAASSFASLAMAVGGGITGVLDSIEERYSTDGKGPTPKQIMEEEEDDSDWEWDGTVNEDAHMDLW